MASFRNHRGADAICMLILMLGLCAAAGAVEFAGGTGEIDDPYQIATAEQLFALGSDPNLYDRHFVLVADIDLDPNLPGGRVFDRAVIAPTASDTVFSGTAFSGSFDGALHTISNLTIVVQSQSTYVSHLGLIGCVAAEGRVSRLRVTNARISQSQGLRSSGLLCGENRGIIRDCHASGEVSYSNYTRGVGGVAGVNDGFVYRSTAEADLSFGNPATVKKSAFMAVDANSMVPLRGGGTAAAAAAPQMLGALVGSNSGIIADCHATGSVTGSSYSSSMGGIAGANGNAGMVAQCYCVLREGSARRCVGSVEGAVANSYYLRDPAIPDPGPRYGIGLTDSEMRQQTSFVGWDFAERAEDGTSDTWTMPVGGGYPVLAGERPFDLAGQGTEEGPFLVGSVQDLGLIVQRPGAYYRLTADIDCSGIVWAAMLVPWFGGTLDGAGYTISHVELRTTGPGGLLGRVGKHATIRNFHLDDFSIAGSPYSWYVGALACINTGAIVNCSATGRIDGNNYVGGLIGRNDGAVCSCRANVTVAGTGLAYRVGGLIGANGEGIVVGCHAGGFVTAPKSSVYIGGLIGIHGTSVAEDIDGVSVINCCSTGAVVGGRYVGGLIGSSSRRVLNCHAAGSVEGAVGSHGAMDAGGLIGVHTGGVIAGCYFLDPNDGGGPDNGVGERLSPRQMAEMESFSGWDFAERVSDGIANVWSLPEGAAYPLPSGLDRKLLSALEGVGSATSPYLIRSGAQIGALSQNPTACFRLDADINLEGTGHGGAPIPLFAGHLDGAGHSISGLSVTCSGYGGLFGVIHDRASVRDLRVVDANVVGLENEPLIGILAGLNRGNLAGCHVQGNVRGYRYTGGLVGVHTGSATMTRCRAEVTISTSDGIYIGGLVGVCRDAMLSECSAVATILGKDYLQATGGLAGDVSFGTVARCFALGEIRGGVGTWHLGGLVGNLAYGQILDCYAGVDIVAGARAHRVGGMLGDAFGESVRNCYSRGRVAVGEESGEVGGLSGFGAMISGGNLWDRQTSGLDWSFGGTGLTTDQMKRAGTFLNLGWDFAGETANGTADIWTICEGKDYPRLTWEQVTCE